MRDGNRYYIVVIADDDSCFRIARGLSLSFDRCRRRRTPHYEIEALSYPARYYDRLLHERTGGEPREAINNGSVKCTRVGCPRMSAGY